MKDFMELTDNDCCWVIGEPDGPNTRFCGKPRKDGFSYCSEHVKQAYQGVQERAGHMEGA